MDMFLVPVALLPRFPAPYEDTVELLTSRLLGKRPPFLSSVTAVVRRWNSITRPFGTVMKLQLPLRVGFLTGTTETMEV